MMGFLVVPLAVCSNISSLSSINMRAAGFMGGLTVATFVISNILACVVGLLYAIV